MTHSNHCITKYLTISTIKMQLLYQITPTSIYIRLSNLYNQILEYLVQVEIDPQLYDAVNRGVILGVAILTFFILFPGEPFNFQTEDKDGINAQEATKGGHEKEDSLAKEQTAKEHSAQRQRGRGGDHEEQQEKGGSQVNVRLIMNLTVYAFIVFGGMYILDKSYGIAFKDVIKPIFPKEAAVLGF